MKNRIIVLVIIATSVFLSASSQTWNLVWADEFNGTTVDQTKWTFTNKAWPYNSELEYYTSNTKNIKTENGNLVITAIKEDFGGRNYTSAKIDSRNKADFLYGKFEFRAKLGQGKGIWPAFWLMPTVDTYGGWPKSGEQDIMENLGHEPSKVYGTLHYDNNGHQQTGANYTLSSGTFASDFHIFTYEWNVNSEKWYIDGHLYSTKTMGTPYDHKFYIIINLAVGGSWPGNPDATTVFPNTMYVDYVRVYKLATDIENVDNTPKDIYPNPANDNLYINTNGNAEVTIFNIYSQKVLSSNIESEGPMDISKLNPGTYIVCVNEAGAISKYKIVVQR